MVCHVAGRPASRAANRPSARPPLARHGGVCFASWVAAQDALGAYWNGIYYAMLVYDVSNPESFESCKIWLEELKKARWVEGARSGGRRQGGAAAHRRQVDGPPHQAQQWLCAAGPLHSPLMTPAVASMWRVAACARRPDKDRPLKAVLVATKSDLPSQRHHVQDDVAVVWANANGLEFFPVSSVSRGWAGGGADL